ncbi:MAG: hypothetical protein NZL93_02540, partial [Chthoniobacterales bacterium]|nr:hypothetical protein [Chthoniobacterales bacterium]
YLINLLLSHSPEPHLLQNYLSKLPPADSIIFNGHQLLGAALARPDNLIGLDSLPIALSRRIPALLFPLRNDQAPLLTQFVQTSSFSLSTLRTRTQNFYQAPIADLLFADGLFLRPYSGKIDDLYVHFVQKNHTLLSILSFYAIAESLPARRYSPITGIGSPLSVPTPWFNVNDILSGGALLAVEQYRSSHQTPSSIPNPFSNFAIRILPYLDSSINSLQPGSTLTISRELIREAIRHPKRFSPKPVPPILNDPSRFFGSYSPIFQLASRRLSRKELATAIRQIDFETPLPDIPATPSANELLAEPTSWAPAFSEDEIPLLPQEENSLSEELAFTPPPQNPSPPPTKRVEPIYPEPILPKTPTQQPNQSKPQKNIPSPLPSEPPLVATLPTFSIQNQIITSNSVGQHFLPQTQNSSTTQSLAAPFFLPNPISQETTFNSTSPSPPPPSTLLAQIPSPQSKTPEVLLSNNPTAEAIPQPTPIPNPQLTLPSPSPHRLTPTQSPTPTPNLPLSLPQEKASPSELPAPSSLLASLLSPTEPHSSPIHLSLYPTNTLLPPQPYQTSLDLVTAKTSIPLASPTRLEPPSSLLQPSIHPIPAQIPKPDFTINSLPPQPSPLTNLYSSLTTSNFSESPITFSLLHPILLPQTSIPKLPQLEQILPTLAASAPTPTPPQPKPTKSEPIQLPDFSSAPYVAIVTPTIEACESYTTALAAND